MTFYIVDSTLRPPQVKEFSSYPEIVQYLNGVSQRAYGQTRKQRMILLEELGNGYDDPDSVNFVRSMAENFEMGIIRTDIGKRRVKCDITSIPLYQQEEFGN